MNTIVRADLCVYMYKVLEFFIQHMPANTLAPCGIFMYKRGVARDLIRIALVARCNSVSHTWLPLELVPL